MIMSNKKEFKKIIESDFDKSQNYKKIISKIESNNQKKVAFKLRYAYIAIFLLIAVIGVSFGGVKARDFIKNYRLEKQNDETRILFKDKVNKDYASDLFKENDYYTYEEIENKLQLKLLKNKKYANFFDSELFEALHLKTNNDKIASIKFSLVNSDKSTRYIDKNWLNITINTNYNDDEYYASFKGANREQEEYYINSLDTVAFIDRIVSTKDFRCSPVQVLLSYNNITYGMRFDWVCNDDVTLNMYGNPNYITVHNSDLYDFLEAFYID